MVRCGWVDVYYGTILNCTNRCCQSKLNNSSRSSKRFSSVNEHRRNSDNAEIHSAPAELHSQSVRIPRFVRTLASPTLSPVPFRVAELQFGRSRSSSRSSQLTDCLSEQDLMPARCRKQTGHRTACTSGSSIPGAPSKPSGRASARAIPAATHPRFLTVQQAKSTARSIACLRA